MDSDLNRLQSVYRERERPGEFWDHRSFHLLVEDVFFLESQFREALFRSIRLRFGAEAAWEGKLRVSELGCGWGRNLLTFVELGLPVANIRGMELMPHFVETAGRLYPFLNVQNGDARHTQWTSATEDLVLIHTVLSAILDPLLQRELLTEAVRLLKPGGLLLIMDIKPGYPTKYSEDESGRSVPFLRAPNLNSLVHGLGGLGEVRERVDLGLRPMLRSALFRRANSVFPTRLWTRFAGLLSLSGFFSTHEYLCWEKRGDA
jgi:SAM-dependent methyltransferase